MENPTMSVGAALIVASGLTVVLVVLHLAAPRLRSLPLVPERVTGSFAGGLAVAYVFLHLLPEIAAGNEAVGEALGDVVEVTPLLELSIFMVALAGFTLFYGLQRLAEHRGSSQGVYVLHLAAFAVYNALITYTLPLRVRTGLAFAVLFAVAIGLHFVLTDRGLEEHYGQRFDRRSRLLLAGALVLGLVLGAVAAPTSTVVVSLLTALVGGSVLWNVFREEVPSSARASFSWFLVGLVLYGGLLTLVTALGA